MGALLDWAGDERFGLKVAHFRRELAVKDGDQIVYECLMRALGYSKNKKPFKELAYRLPLKALQVIASGERAPAMSD